MPHLYGSYVKLNIYGTNKMIMKFIMDYQVHKELVPLIEELTEEINKLMY